TRGGALDVIGITLLCTASLISSNTAGSTSTESIHHGGGIRIDSNAVVNLTNLKIEHCRAGVGGGVFVRNSVMVGTALQFTGNHAFDVGAAIASRFGLNFSIDTPRAVKCHSCNFTKNEVVRAGTGKALGTLLVPELKDTCHSRI
ncbi:MAG: hypothetical protein AAF525_08285, partial [Pseudomonadota bacterium]